MPAQEVVIRTLQASDVEGLALLLDELGYPAPVATLTGRLEQLARAGDAVFVAARDHDVLGFATAHVTPVLHRPRPVGRLTALVVANRAQKQGVGRALVAEVERHLATRGCGLVELTSNRSRTGAHEFYRRLGYDVTSYCFRKVLPATE